MDFFNLLPDHLLLSILSSLPLTDAARTSLLSRRWAHQWADYLSHKTDFNLDLDLLFPENAHKQAQLVNTIISSPRLTIRKFQILGLRGYRGHWFRPNDPRDLAQWVHKLVEKGVKELSLMNRGHYCNAPSCLLSSKSLTVLKLRGCCLETTRGTSIVSCTNLKSLELNDVSISVDVVTELVRTCEKLEFLSLGNYCVPERDELVVSSQSLMKLHLKNCSYTWSNCDIKVSAPNLDELELQMKVRSLCVYVPKVRKCSFWINGWEMDERSELLTQFVAGIGSSRCLNMQFDMLNLLSMCIISWESRIRFDELKKLRLDICTADVKETSALNAFLRSCPHLQELRLDVKKPHWKTESSEYVQPFYCPTQCLDKVELIGLRGYEYEMSILKFVQAKQGVFSSETKEECDGMTFLEKYSQDLVIDKGKRKVSFKLGECRIRIVAACSVDHFAKLLSFDLIE